MYAGRDFWSWLNNNEPATQDWVMDGILAGFQQAASADGSLAKDISEFRESFVERFKDHAGHDDAIDWHGILKMING